MRIGIRLSGLQGNASLAQMVEQRTENPCVRSSILRAGTKKLRIIRSFLSFWLKFYEGNYFPQLTNTIIGNAPP